MAKSGSFTTLAGGGVARSRIARLSSPAPAVQSLRIDGDRVTWTRGGAGPELALPPVLEFSLAGVDYAPLATLDRIPGGWQVDGFEPPIDQSFYLRARGPVRSGHGSQGEIRYVRQFHLTEVPDLPEQVFADGFE